MSSQGRRAGAAVLVAAASVLLVLAVAAGYVRRAAVDSDQFANRATAALEDDSVRALVAARITDDVVLRKEADLVAARPIIQSVASEIVGSRAFTRVFRAGVRDVHRAVFARDQQTVTLGIADAGTVLAAALRAVRPSLADDVASAERVALVRRDIGGAAAEVAAPLFLLNHWVTTDPLPRPADADRVNRYSALLRRVRACERRRGRRPNLVAVNYYRRGDVARVVDTHNGVR